MPPDMKKIKSLFVRDCTGLSCRATFAIVATLAFIIMFAMSLPLTGLAYLRPYRP